MATSHGLRTLSPTDPAYRPHYGGDVPARDGAYHQGPAWAWLLPHYALAVHRVTGDAAGAQSLLDPFADHLTDAGLGSISELFDAEPPHAPRGAPAQAWSVACTLDAWCRLEQAKGAANGSPRGQPLDGATTAAHRSH
ncbi:amylo-alpha-1,6-glucosidase [Thiocapsa sp.]|uniref:amylo-alpha-1,6-glucosidase n=1 Tax=Thiocapsa sp. TaxID=2024551 RepID=UPI0035942568